MAQLVRFLTDEDNEEWGLYPLQGRTMDWEPLQGRPTVWEPRILEDCEHRGVFFNRGVLKRLLMDEESGMVVVTKHLVRSGSFGGERIRATSVAFYEPI